MELSEGDISKQIQDWLKANGFLFWRNNIGVRYVGKGVKAKNPMRGLPDICGVLSGGKFFGIEVKKPKEKPSEEQEKWHEALRKKDAIVIVARSLEDVTVSLLCHTF